MIKIEVTGNSIGEVADKLLAIGANLKGTAIIEGARAAVNAMKAMEVAEKAPADPTPSEAVSSGETEASPTAPSGPEPEAPTTGEPLNFELDVAPVVLRAVALKTKSFVQDVLGEFGSARASELDPARWPELIDRLEAEMA